MRSMKVLVAYLALDMFFVVMTTIWFLQQHVQHHLGGQVAFGLLWLVWVRCAWTDLDRWTGPKRRSRLLTRAGKQQRRDE